MVSLRQLQSHIGRMWISLVSFVVLFNVPIYFTTDVNSSAFGEVVARNNAGGRIENLVYYTIGTGIGAGAIQRGEFIGGAGHPEMGHYYVAKHPMDVEKRI